MFKEEMQIRELNTKLHTALSRIEVLENESVGREKELESVKSDRRILDGRCGEREKELEDARALWEGEKVSYIILLFLLVLIRMIETTRKSNIIPTKKEPLSRFYPL